MSLKKVRIGIDVDGVLRDFVGKVAELALDEGVVVPEPKTYEYLGQKVGDLTLRQKIWGTKEWLEPTFVDATEFDGAYKAYVDFCENPLFEVYIVTAQYPETEWLTEKWLTENGYDKHIRTIYSRDKLVAPCQVLIDDAPHNIDDYEGANRMGIIIDRSYNRDKRYKHRAISLRDAYNMLVEKYG
jgi:5'(3')-deoxyribonucleotidase